VARIIFVGGGIVGLSAAHMLGRDGHDVTVIERDPAPPTDPEAAWNDWDRKGVNQFRMLHFFQPRFNVVMSEAAPELIDAMLEAGALDINPFRDLPAEITGGMQPGDEQFTAITARRPVGEAAIAGVLATNPNVTIRRATAVTALLTEPGASGIPNVVGVRTDSGEELRADYVVDAAGRRSTLPALLQGVGAREPVEEKEDCGFIYYGRHFQSSDGSVPAMMGPLLMPCGTVSILSLPADNGTWGIGVVTSAKDKELRALKDVDAWMRVVKSFPLQAHWLDGEPLNDSIAVMAKIEDRHRSFVVDGQPVATGVFSVGDSWAATNPSVGRGMTIGAMHAVALRETLNNAADDPVELAQQWHDATMASVEPWYRATLAFDAARLDEIHAGLEGREFQPDAQYEITLAMMSAAGKAPDTFRSAMQIVGVLRTPEEVFAEPGVFERVVELGSNWRNEVPVGPSREELLAAVAG
jgi:2-polyprenyl-6-methoxyphenol hydroxylase-like FAD-dependent oxidoreductase